MSARRAQQRPTGSWCAPFAAYWWWSNARLRRRARWT